MTFPPVVKFIGPTGVIVATGKALTVIASVRAVPLPQALTADTPMFPEVLPNATVTDVVPCPEVIDEPAGTVQA